MRVSEGSQLMCCQGVKFTELIYAQVNQTETTQEVGKGCMIVS